MNSVPVQFLIYVTSEPVCSEAPGIIPLTDCLVVTVSASKSFNLFMLNLCDPDITGIADIIVTDSTSDIQMGNLVNSSMNTSLF